MSDSATPKKQYDIPVECVELCKEIAVLAAKYDLLDLNVSFRLSYKAAWRHGVSMRWETGRHGDSMHKLYISSQVDIHEKIDLPRTSHER
ncbi:MAG: hypothetical protein ACK52I_06620 [Pseudomonadota bacterium]|jgi:hypothetical protein